jgi:prophage regulatory protein
MSVSKRLLKRKAVEEKTGRSTSWIYAAIPRGDFPAPVETGPGSVAWHEHEVDRWIAERPRRDYQGSRPRGRSRKG